LKLLQFGGQHMGLCSVIVLCMDWNSTWSKIYERKFKLIIEIIITMILMWWPLDWFGLTIYVKYGWKFNFCLIIYGTKKTFIV
jgi:hypothetical protein